MTPPRLISSKDLDNLFAPPFIAHDGVSRRATVGTFFGLRDIKTGEFLSKDPGDGKGSSWAQWDDSGIIKANNLFSAKRTLGVKGTRIFTMDGREVGVARVQKVEVWECVRPPENTNGGDELWCFATRGRSKFLQLVADDPIFFSARCLATTPSLFEAQLYTTGLEEPDYTYAHAGVDISHFSAHQVRKRVESVIALYETDYFSFRQEESW